MDWSGSLPWKGTAPSQLDPHSGGYELAHRPPVRLGSQAGLLQLPTQGPADERGDLNCKALLWSPAAGAVGLERRVLKFKSPLSSAGQQVRAGTGKL